MSAPVCTCGHLVVDDRRCACLGKCDDCVRIDCCAETWALYIAGGSDLPGMWEEADFLGGAPDEVRSAVTP
jgi:hypothetical protein